MLASSMLNNLLFDPAYLVIGIIAVCVLLLIMVMICLVKISGLKRKYKKAMAEGGFVSAGDKDYTETADFRSLKEAGEKAKNEIDNINSGITSINDGIVNINTGLGNCFQKSAVIRYDALNMAGQSSFALTLLDGHNDGVILNSIHTREGSYLYLKEIHNGTCEYKLGKEEQDCLNQAISK